MKSIRAKTFWTFTSVVLGILILTVLLNTLLFKPFAIGQDKRVFRELEKIVQVASSGGQLDTNFLSDLSAGYGVQIDIVDRYSNRVIYSSSAVGQGNMGHRMRYRTSFGNLDLTTDEHLGFRQVETQNGDEVLMLVSPLSPEAAVVVYRPIEIIDRTVNQVNRFVLLVGIALLTLGGAIIYWLAGRQVKPILDLHQQTENMAKLDFSGRFETTSQDEVSKLGENINAISDKLSATINTLESDVQKLTEVDRVRKQFIASVSHDFKSPLGIIKGYTEAIKYQLVSPGETEAYLDTIIGETDRLDQLVKDLIVLMKQEMNQTDPKREPVEICQFLDQVVSRHQASNPTRNYRLDCQVETVVMDELAITRVIDNFLQNANRYGEPDTPIQVTTRTEADEVIIEIHNVGPRIPEDQRQAIWDSFYKLDPSRTGNQEGTGLGLAINKAIIEAHGGSYGSHNTADGVTFFFGLKKAS